MKTGLPFGSAGSGGIWTKCRSSEAEVPTYRLRSGRVSLSPQWIVMERALQTKIIHTIDRHIILSAIRVERGILKQCAQDKRPRL